MATRKVIELFKTGDGRIDRRLKEERIHTPIFFENERHYYKIDRHAETACVLAKSMAGLARDLAGIEIAGYIWSTATGLSAAYTAMATIERYLLVPRAIELEIRWTKQEKL